MFVPRQFHWLNALLLLSLLSQLLSGCPVQALELWCLETAQLHYRTTCRQRLPVWKAPFHSQAAWLMRWLVHTGPRWSIRCGLLAVILWRNRFPRLAWVSLALPLIEVLCLGLGVLSRPSHRRRQWWRWAHWLNRSYVGVVLLLLVLGTGAPSGALCLSKGSALSSSVPMLPLMLGVTVAQHPEPAEVRETEERAIHLVQGQDVIRLMVRDVVVFEVPAADQTGLRWLVHQLLRQELLSQEEAADLLGLSRRTVRRYLAAYEEEQDSACLVDRRRFNSGQQKAYRAQAYQGQIVRQCVRNLLTGAPNNGRHLKEQTGNVLGNRTLDRSLERWGILSAERLGVRRDVEDYLEAVRQAAYWAGVEGKSLEEVPDLPDDGWEQQISGRATLSLTTLHLANNGAYEAAHKLVGKRKGFVSAKRAWHNLLTHLTMSGGDRLSQAKHMEWEGLRGLLGGRVLGVSASFLRQWVADVAEKAKEMVTIRRSDGEEETITRLRAYQEESVAQRVQRGLVEAQVVWLDCYVNGVYRKERIVRAWHGTKHWSVKAFRRNLAQDVETEHLVTCPLSPSDVTSLYVLKQARDIIDGGLDRAGALHRLARVTADRWWSVKPVLAYCQEEGLGLLCWGKAVKTVLKALAELEENVDEEDTRWKEVKESTVDPDTGEVKEEIVGYRLETELEIYDLPEPVRAVVDWDGDPESRKIARLAMDVDQEALGTEALCEELRRRQQVEIEFKFLHRWLQFPNFGGGEAIERPDERVCPSDEEALKKLRTERKRTTTRMRNARAKLEQVQKELEHLTADDNSQPRNDLLLSVQDLRSLEKRLKGQIERAAAKLKDLAAWIAWGKGEGPAPEREPEYELDLTREAILTQAKLDVFTAYKTLVDEFIELALKPVLREEAEHQAAERKRLDKRSAAKGREGEPLCTDVETLYEIKVANLERETILERLINQPGRHLYHRGEKILVTVAQRFSDRRMQAAYERYCHILNQKRVRVPMDDGEEWLLLFTYEKPPPSEDKIK